MASIKKCLMAIFLIAILSVALPPEVFAAGAADGVENPKSCKQCGMDRTVFTRSRMLIVYADGTTVGVCSLHCAAAEMRQNRDKQVKSLMVADYVTQELIDAKTATWVVGGNKQGVMTSLPKWAFAKGEDAQKFVKENGGEVTIFAEAMGLAEEEISGEAATTHTHTHAGHDMGLGAQMLFNPAMGDQIYHTHPAGMWMFNYKFMHMDMNGLRDGTTNVSQENVGFMRGKPYNYMMIPTDMTMDMYMFMAMYGITDRLTVMAMANYLWMNMSMLMDMGPMSMKPVKEEPPMTVNGFSDTELRAMYKINKYLVGSLGLIFPTGSIDNEFTTMGRTYRNPYDMQLSSGTYDLSPALTYNGLSDDAKWNWGAQVQCTWHIGENNNGWSFGDNFKVTSWLQRALGPVTSWLRLAYNDTGKIRGYDPEIAKLLDPNPMKGASMPDADPNNYGGQRLDGAIGLSFQKGPFSIGFEGGIPLYQNLNGLQLKTSWFLNAGLQIMF
ncbi:MAG TPA: nitrous oxide reductase accessory protein NosL [Thermodesulfovibrionales bacterium]|nr:nitrous oxide reductase accessory protein NosL [Thermodesulfovibrionales bacterium]